MSDGGQRGRHLRSHVGGGVGIVGKVARVLLRGGAVPRRRGTVRGAVAHAREQRERVRAVGLEDCACERMASMPAHHTRIVAVDNVVQVASARSHGHTAAQ